MPASTVTAKATVTVTIKDFEFSPSTLQIKVGDTVVWNNTGPSSHTATSQNGMWDTGELRMGESSYFTFTQPGMFSYICQIHPRMRGSITVAPEPMTQTGTVGGMAVYSGPFDGGYSTGFGYAGSNPMGPYGASSLYTQQAYYYDPSNGYYYASAYPGYPYNLGYGAWWGGQYGYGYPFSYMGGYGYPGYSSINYPYYGGGYGGGYPYGGYGGGYGGYPYSYYSPYSYSPYFPSYGSAYSGYNPSSYYPYGYQSPYASLYYSYYRYPYSSAYGYYPYSASAAYYPYYANSAYLYSFLGYYSPYNYYGYGYSPYTTLYGAYGYGTPYSYGYPYSYLGSPYIY
jgi:plastocyanin